MDHNWLCQFESAPNNKQTFVQGKRVTLSQNRQTACSDNTISDIIDDYIPEIGLLALMELRWSRSVALRVDGWNSGLY